MRKPAIQVKNYKSYVLYTVFYEKESEASYGLWQVCDILAPAELLTLNLRRFTR